MHPDCLNVQVTDGAGLKGDEQAARQRKTIEFVPLVKEDHPSLHTHNPLPLPELPTLMFVNFKEKKKTSDRTIIQLVLILKGG